MVLANPMESSPSSKLSVYLQQLSGQIDPVPSVLQDHSYCRPVNWKADNIYAKPIKTLFITKSHSIVPSSGSLVVDDDKDERKTPTPAYFEDKARKSMNETEKILMATLGPDAGDPDWEAKLTRTQWSVTQTKLFDRAIKILNHDRLSRLSHSESWNEPVLRRVTIEKTARRFRSLLAAFGWHSASLHWLHNTFIDFLDVPYLVSYIDVLQTLKKKVPSLVERMVSSVNYNSRVPPEVMNRLLKKPADPATYSLPCYDPKRLPGNPLIVIVPSSPGTNTLQNPRVQRWYQSLSMIGHVSLVSTNNLLSTKATMITSLDHMLAATRAKLAELRSDHVGRNIILVGFNTGAALACQVALLENVKAIICIGFPLNTVEGKRGQPDDNLLNLSVPVLFIAGEHGTNANKDDLEDLRERLRVESGLVIVGSADDQLRVTKSTLYQEGVTQSMVDHCIVDEIADFVGTILTAPPPQARNEFSQNSQISSLLPKKFVEKKRKLSEGEDSGIATSRKTGVSQPRTRGGRVTTRGGARSKWVAGGLNVPASRKPQSKDMLFSPRQSIESMGLSGPDVSIDEASLPQRQNENDENLIDQLTPDRLLEMPVIIAQEEATHEQNLNAVKSPTIKTVLPRGRVGRPPTTFRRLGAGRSTGPVKILLGKDSPRQSPTSGPINRFTMKSLSTPASPSTSSSTITEGSIKLSKDGRHRIRQIRPMKSVFVQNALNQLPDSADSSPHSSL